MSAAPRRIGALDVTIAGLGCNNFGRRIDEARTREVVDAALDAGVGVFDTADLYGDGASEQLLGKALGARRDDVVVVTKFGMRRPPDGMTGGDPSWVARACDGSLRRLGTDRIDVYLLHTPDEATPVGDTLEAMGGLVDEGKVREIGCSNFSPAQLDEAAAAASERSLRPFVVVQNEYSLLHREPEAGVLEACDRLGMSLMPYYPLASGLLSGKYRRGEPAPAGRLGGGDGRAAEDVVDAAGLDASERLTAYAESKGHTLLELSLSWLASRSQVATAIAGATSAEQVRANAAATRAWTLTGEDQAEIDGIVGPD